MCISLHWPALFSTENPRKLYKCENPELSLHCRIWKKQKQLIMRPLYNWISACKAVSTADVLPMEHLVKYESTLVHFLNASDKNHEKAPSTFLEQPSLISNMITLSFHYFTKNNGPYLPPQITYYLLNLQTFVHSTSQNYQHNCER